MQKGDRVRVVSGRKDQGTVGTVFWTGEDRYNEGETRLGLRADDGRTVWISASHCEVVSEDDAEHEPPAPPEPPEKGTRVEWEKDGSRGTGRVFWVGENKSGIGYRVGVEDEAMGEAVWLDARQVEAIDDDVPPAMPGDPAPGASQAPPGDAPPPDLDAADYDDGEAPPPNLDAAPPDDDIPF